MKPALATLLACLLCLGCARRPPAQPDDFPAPGLPRSETLVSPHWVWKQLQAKSPSLVIVEASWAPAQAAKDYLAGHPPGAIHLNTDELETGYPAWRLRDVSELQEVLGQAGIAPGSQVVVYSRQVIAAARVWWILKYAGVGDVRLMDGGFEAWRAAGYPSETTVHARPATRFSAPPDARLLAGADWIEERLESNSLRLIDVRSRAEFLGERSGYRTLSARGRLPGALHAGDADDEARIYVGPDGRLRPPRDIVELWIRSGLVPAGTTPGTLRDITRDGPPWVFYCGGGWRSSLAFFHAWLLGVDQARNYSDGWSGWSTRFQPSPGAGSPTPDWQQIPTGRRFETR